MVRPCFEFLPQHHATLWEDVHSESGNFVVRSSSLNEVCSSSGFSLDYNEWKDRKWFVRQDVCTREPQTLLHNTLTTSPCLSLPKPISQMDYHDDTSRAGKVIACDFTKYKSDCAEHILGSCISHTPVIKVSPFKFSPGTSNLGSSPFHQRY